MSVVGPQFALASLLGLLLGLTCSVGSTFALLDDMHAVEALRTSKAEPLMFQLVEDARVGQYGQTVNAITTVDNRSIRVEVRVRTDARLYYGDVISGDVAVREISGEKAGTYWDEGVAGIASITHPRITESGSTISRIFNLRKRVVSIIDSATRDDDAKTVAKALICGYKVDLHGSDSYLRFQTCGLAHLVAVSGAHLNIIGSIVALLCSTLGLKRRVSVCVQAIFVGFYLLLAAIPVSGIRASLMMSCALLSVLTRRRASGLNALGLCLVIMLSLDAHQALSVSFCLSAGSTLGIILLSSYGGEWLYAIAPRFPRFVRDGLSVTVAASIATLPYSMALFCQLPLISFVSNVVASPIFTVACAGGMLCAVVGLVVPFLSGIAGLAITGLSHVLCIAVELLSMIPGGCVPATMQTHTAVFISVSMISGLYAWWPKPDRWKGVMGLGSFALTFVLASVIWSHPFATEIIMLDVGQGDAFIVRSNGRQIMIDTGNQPSKLKQALARNGIHRLDALVISHPDDDHCGCIKELAQVVDVSAVFAAKGVLACSCESCAGLRRDAPHIKPLSMADCIQCGSVTLTVVWPFEFVDEGGNADSLCLLVDADVNGDGIVDQNALFCGDAESAQLHEMLDMNLISGVTIYKVGHHGSKKALDDQTSALLHPSISLVSVGASNRYGHPAPETLNRLNDVGSKVYRTDLQGDVVCRLGADGVRVKTLR